MIDHYQVRHRAERDAAQREEQVTLHRYQVQAGSEASRGGSGKIIYGMARIHSAETGCVYIFQLPQTVSPSFAVQKTSFCY